MRSPYTSTAALSFRLHPATSYSALVMPECLLDLTMHAVCHKPFPLLANVFFFCHTNRGYIFQFNQLVYTLSRYI